MSKICSAHELSHFIERLRRKVEAEPSVEAFTELDTALEELKVAEETVHEQTEALEKALQRADTERQRYLELFEFAPDGYCVTDSRGVIVEANRAMCELLKSPLSAVIEKPLLVFVPLEQKRELRRFIVKVRQPHPEPAQRDRAVWQTEFQLGRRDPIPVSARCSVSRRQEPDPPRLLWLLRDMTEQRRAEDRLKQARHDLEDLVDAKTRELQERLEELEGFHDVAVGRELRLIELEKKLQAFKALSDRHEDRSDRKDGRR
jgi:PAS domain S-box-containing protein